jgi:hypothetical protein
VVGELATATILSGVGLALATPAVRRRVATGLKLDEAYLTRAGRTLLRPPSWRSFVAEQRVLVRELPALENRLREIAAPTTIVSGARHRREGRPPASPAPRPGAGGDRPRRIWVDGGSTMA